MRVATRRLFAPFGRPATTLRRYPRFPPRADDETVLKRTVRKNAVLVTEDHDFGRLVHAAGRVSTGVVLLRYPPALREQIAESVCGLAKQHGEELAGRFVVVEPGRIRMSALPQG
jgi:predicted nuclease of predicted toxin-antitoxin system